MKQYKEKTENIFGSQPYDYYVSIGTPASLAMKAYLDSNKITNKKFIFLGVTDPVACGLVTSLEFRSDNDNIGGVAYCGNFELLPARIHQIFPDRKLIYIYNSLYPQDEQLANQLQNRLSKTFIRDGTLSILKLNRNPIVSDFTNKEAIYFSWGTLESLFDTNWGDVLSKIPYIVSTTKTHAERGLVPFAVSTSDEEIGNKGADLLIDNLTKKTNLGSSNIYVPIWRVYYNCKMAEKKGISLTVMNSLLKRETDKGFDCDTQ